MLIDLCVRLFGESEVTCRFLTVLGVGASTRVVQGSTVVLHAYSKARDQEKAEKLGQVDFPGGLWLI